MILLEEGGRNRTPDKLPVREKKPLNAACDEALRATIGYLRPAYVVGIGVFARDCALRALEGFDVTIGTVLHPSPASPKAKLTAEMTHLTMVPS